MGLKFAVYSKEEQGFCLGRASSMESFVELIIDLYREDGYQPEEMIVVVEGD